LADDPDSLEYLLGCVDDSKKLTPSAREYAFGVILAHARYVGIGAASNEEIDLLGIAPATRLAWSRALGGLRKVDYLLLDAFRLPESDLPQLPLVRGDAQSLSIAAASILAKVARDRQMRSTAMALPHYGFERNKGYGTPYHRHALRLHGPCGLHRRSFAPMRQPERCEE
jgi:ribonuclease HII